MLNLVVAIALCLTFVRSEYDCKSGQSMLPISSLSNDVVTEKDWSYVVLLQNASTTNPTRMTLLQDPSQKSYYYCVNVEQDYLLMLTKDSSNNMKICGRSVLKPGSSYFVRVTASGECSSFSNPINEDSEVEIVDDKNGISRVKKITPFVVVATTISGFNNNPSSADIDAMIVAVAMAEGVMSTSVEIHSFQPSTGILKTKTRLPLLNDSDIDNAYHSLVSSLKGASCSGRFTQYLRSSGGVAFANVAVVSNDISRVRLVAAGDLWKMDELYYDMVILSCQSATTLRTGYD